MKSQGGLLLSVTLEGKKKDDDELVSSLSFSTLEEGEKQRNDNKLAIIC